MTSFSPIDDSECIINWRKKDFMYKETWYSYNNAPVVLSYKNKDYLHVIPNSYRFALKDMFTSPRCRVCYDKINTFADVVLGDPWRMGNTDEERGASVVAVRTETGLSLIKGALKNNILQLEEREVQQIVTGQLIEERRKSVAIYSHALECLPRKMDSYLYEQGSDILLDEKEVAQAKENLQTFIKREGRTIELIIKESCKIIDDWLKLEKKNKNIFVRIIRKIQRILSK